MDYKFEIGGGETKEWSDTHRATFHDWPDSLGLRMTKRQGFALLGRLAQRLAESSNKKDDDMLPTLGYCGKLEKDKW